MYLYSQACWGEMKLHAIYEAFHAGILPFLVYRTGATGRPLPPVLGQRFMRIWFGGGDIGKTLSFLPRFRYAIFHDPLFSIQPLQPLGLART
jgi:hypothetical protein